MRAALLILRKDLLQRVRDRTVWIVGVVAPLALAAILGVVVGGFGPPSLEPPTWAVVDLDGGLVGDSLVEQVLPVVADSLDGFVEEVASRQEAERAVDDGRFDAAFILGSGMSQAVLAGGTGSLEVIGRLGDDIGNAVAQAVADEWALDVAITRSAIVAAGLGSDAGLRAPNVLTIDELAGADRTLDGATYVAAGMGVFFLFFTVGLGVIGYLEERTNGTLARLQAAPIPGWAPLAGKILTSVVIGYLATAILVLGTTLLLGASWGPTIPVLVLVAAAVVAAVSLVTVVAAFAQTADSAGSIQSVIGIVLGMLGGAFFPVASEPGPLATASDLTPHGMFLTAVGDLQVPGASLVDIAPQLLGLLAFGLVTATAGGAIGRLRAAA